MSHTEGYLLMRRPLSAPAPAVALPDGVALSPLVAADAVAIHRLLEASYAPGYGSVRPDPLDWWEAMVTDREFDRNLAFVAKAGAQVVGFCLVWNSSFLKDIVVDAVLRRHGIGSALLATAIAAMQARGHEELALKVDIYNANAQRLYQQFGFVAD
jgi:ribosomal protein S18 acetylase RimI-like enzyme